MDSCQSESCVCRTDVVDVCTNRSMNISTEKATKMIKKKMSKSKSQSSASEPQPEPQPSGSKVQSPKVVCFPCAYSPGGTLRLNDIENGVAYERAMSDLVLGSDDESEEDDENENFSLYEEDFFTASVGWDVRQAMSHLRDEDNECVVYEEWKRGMENANTEATAAQNLIGMKDVEVNIEIINEGMDGDMEMNSEKTDEGLGMSECTVNMSDVVVIGDVDIGMVDESQVGAAASENEIGEDRQVELVEIGGQSARGRDESDRQGKARDGGGSAGAREESAQSRLVEPSPFTWSDDYSTYHAQQETYTRTPGPTIAATDPVEIFLNIWDKDVMSMIVEETERYAWQIISAQSETERGVPASLEWDGTSVEEMYRMFAIIILMSFCVKGNAHEYWTTGLLEMPKFREIMPRNRFFTLLRFMHFVDNQNRPSNLSKYQARMYKIQPIIDHCNQKFSTLFVPGQFLSLDESLLLWKGRLSFVQCIQRKRAQLGIKSYELCDVTGYLVRTILYGGKGTVSAEEPLGDFSKTTSKVVLELMEGYLDCGHCLVMDNWYNQLFLTRYLKGRKTDVIGTINPRRVHVPPAIKDLSPSSLERGDMVAQHCGDISLLAWMDVKLVTTVSTYHGNETIIGKRAGHDIVKPLVIENYNKSMGGVDLKDAMLSAFLTERKRGSKWYMKVFKRMLNTSLLNSFIIYRANAKRQGHEKVMTHRSFREAVVGGLLQRFPNKRCLSNQRAQNQAREAKVKAAGVRHVDLHLHRTVRTALVPGTNVHRQKRCAQCSSEGRRHMVRWMCEKCNVPLEPGNCFSKYHGSMTK